MPSLSRILLPGDRVDRYELLCPVARGGMGEVWAARRIGAHGFEKLVALKTLLPSVEDTDGHRAMFLDEMRLASGVNHPNVCEVLDFGEDSGALYLVLEWVDGESLLSVLRLAAHQGGRLPVGLAVRAIADAARGLHSAHELRDEGGAPLGIVHRDVSLQNILVRYDGVAKVIDFGIATGGERHGKTATGVLKGRLRYLAPEQIEGRTVDRRADVRALGLVLRSLVTGTLPYDGLHGTDLLRAIACATPPGDPADPRIDARLASVLACALAPNREDRFATAATFADALERAVPESVLAAPSLGAFVSTVCAESRARRARRLAEARGRVAIIGPATASLKQALGAFVDASISPAASPARPVTATPAPTDSARASCVTEDDISVDVTFDAVDLLPGADDARSSESLMPLSRTASFPVISLEHLGAEHEATNASHSLWLKSRSAGVAVAAALVGATLSLAVARPWFEPRESTSVAASPAWTVELPPPADALESAVAEPPALAFSTPPRSLALDAGARRRGHRARPSRARSEVAAQGR